MKEKYPQKFISEEDIFKHIRHGAKIFISTGCSEPQYLVNSLLKYVENHPKTLADAELFQVWTLGVAPYLNEKFKYNFRQNSFFISSNIREAVNTGNADYIPIFLFEVPSLFSQGFIEIDVALIQTSLPDSHGFLNLGISVDIVKAVVENASIVIAQMNKNMPRIHGDGFIDIDEVDYIVPYDEPLLEYQVETDDEISKKIGHYVAKLIQDGDTIQVGYGNIPNAILGKLDDKKDLGVHTELLSDSLVNLIRNGVVNNAQKCFNRGKTIATFCMGTKATYEFLDDNPGIEFRTVDYTNNPLIIAQNKHLTAINSALEIDLTGQATAESLGKMFYSGVGGQADFMRGAVLASFGKTVLALESTAENGNLSRIVPYLKEGAGVTLHRSDVYYVVTEYGIAYLHGKNIRERALELISIAHPKFRSWLIEEAKKLHLIYPDQKFISGKSGEYPENLETYKTTKAGWQIFLRPVKLSDEPLLKDFFYSLSDESLYKRFVSLRKDMPHKQLQTFVIIDYSKEMVILATTKKGEKEKVLGFAQYSRDLGYHTAEFAMAVRDDKQNFGIGSELLSYLIFVAKKQGLLGLTGYALAENRPILHIMEKFGFIYDKRLEGNIYKLLINFNRG